MRLHPAEDGRSHAVWLAPSEYEALLDAASTRRKRLIVRLGGEAGLRAAEMTRVRSADLRPVSSGSGAFLVVHEGKDEEREAYLSPALERELERYVENNGLDEESPIIDVSTRRVQMLVSEVASEAAERTGVTDFEKISAHDLRRHFARTMLEEREVDPRVVKAIGGWRSFDALEPYLERPTDAEIVAAVDPSARTLSHAALDEVLLDASTRSDLEQGVCDALVNDFGSDFAWIDGSEFGTRPEPPRAVAGIDTEALTPIRSRIPDGLEDPVSIDVPSIEGGPTVAAAPVVYGETRYGVLALARTNAGFGPDERDRLALLGRRIGHAMTAIRRRKLLLADTILELEFHSSDSNAFFIAASGRCDCRFDLESIVSISDSALLFYLTLTDGAPADVFALTDEFPEIEDWRLVEQRDGGALVEFVVTGASPMLVLTDYGTTITEATFDRGDARLVADCAYDTDLRTLVDGVTGAFPATELVGKQTTDRPARTVQGFRQGAEGRLTDRQRAALRAAYFGGYFDWPRGSTAEEVADAMGVSSPTLHNHLRKGQRELLQVLFDD